MIDRMKMPLAVCLMLIAGPALALDTDFYTYNGFSETVAAFRRLALMLSDNRFLVFAAIFAIAGVLFGALATGYKGLTGEQVNPVAFAIPVLVGLALFKGAVMPTGTVHVYDPVRNAYEPVGGVPNLIVLIAGALNKFERGMIEVADTASANPYSDAAGAINFALIKAATSSEVKDWYLQQSLVNYYMTCGNAYLGNADTGARQRLMHGSDDLQNEFSQWTNAAISVVYHPPGDDRGEVRTCTEAWAGTNGLNARITDPTTFADVTASICRQAGFNMADGGQEAKCRSLLQDSTELYNVSVGSEVPFLRSVLLAGSVSRAMNSADVDRSMRALVNRQVMAEGLGNAEAMNQWIPKVRAFMLAVVLGVVPLTLLFVVTPLIKPALMLNVGLFAWLALWGIGDGIAVQMAYDAAYDAFTEIRRQRLGVEAIMMSPEGSVQALGVFGKSRSTALAMASVLAFGLFKFGGYALTGLGQQWQNNIEGAGDQAGRQQLLPEQNAAMQQQMMGVAGTMGQASSGFRQGSLASGMGQIRQTAEAGAFIDDSVTGGRMAGTVLGDSGRYSAADTLGNVSGTHFGAGAAGVSPESFRASNAETGAAMGGMETFSRRSEADDTFGRANFTAGAAARGVQANAGDAALRMENKPDLYTAGGVETRSRVESAVTMTDRFGPDIGTRAGQAEGLFRGAQAEGTLRTVEDRGQDAFVTAEEVARQQHVAQGLAIQGINPGNIGGTADELAVARAADDMARARIGAGLAQQLGMDPNDVRDRIDLSQMQQGSVGLAVTDSNRAQLADYLQRSGAMSPRELAEFENGDQGFLRFTYDAETGRADAAQADFVSSVSKGNITTETDGRRTRLGDDYHRGDVARTGNERVFSESLQITDPNSLRPEFAPETLRSIIGDVTGTVDERARVAIASGYTQRMGLEGYNDSAAQSKDSGTSAGLNLPFMGGRGTAPKGGFTGSGSAQGSTGGRISSSESSSANQNLVMTKMMDLVTPTLMDAQQSVYGQYGAPDTWSPEVRPQAEAAIAEQWAQRLEHNFVSAQAGIAGKTYVAAARADEKTAVERAREFVAGSPVDRALQFVDGMFR